MRVQIYRLSVIVSMAFLASCAPLPPELTQQIPAKTQEKTPDKISEKLAELPAATDAVIPQSDNLTTSQDDSTSDQSLIAGDDNQTASPKPILLDDSQDEAVADKTDETLIAPLDNQSLSDEEITNAATGSLIGQISDDTNITTPQSNQPEDTQSIDIQAEDIQAAIVIAPDLKTEPKPEPEPEPEPITPVNPYLLTGSVSDLLTIRLGKADRIISEQGVEVRHYYEADCHSLFFLFDKGQGLRIQHVDVRPAILNTALDELACFDALGVRSVNLHEADK
ncbi:MAG: hypothetical protein ACON44_05410 [Candidatus Puniceispirillaceae bacterium]